MFKEMTDINRPLTDINRPLTDINSLPTEDCVLYGDHDYIVDQFRSHYIKEEVKSLVNDLDSLRINNDIISEANEFLNTLKDTVEIDRIRRGRKWKMLTYYCLDRAYISIGEPQDPKDLCKILDLPYNNISKIHKEILNYKTNSIVHVNPDVFVYKYGKDLNISEDHIDVILDITEKIEDFIDDYPQVVAAGLIYYYCNKFKVFLDKRKLQKMVGKSMPTINKISKVIDKLISWE